MRQLDCRGMRCPLPVLYARKALAHMQTGEVLLVTSTDPGSQVDIVEFSRSSGTELVSHHEDRGDYHFLLRKV